MSWRNTLRSEPLFPPLLYFQSKEVMIGSCSTCLGCQRDTANRWGPTVEEPSISAAATQAKSKGKRGNHIPSDCRAASRLLPQGECRTRGIAVPTPRRFHNQRPQQTAISVSGSRHLKFQSYGPSQPQKILRLDHHSLMEQATLSKVASSTEGRIQIFLGYD